MSSEFTLRTVTDYLALPELEIPIVVGEELPGLICRVLGIDFYIAPKADCEARGLEALEIPDVDRCALPTAVVELGDEVVFFRLPQSLAPWVFDIMKSGEAEQFFPASVDFGIRCDQHYATFL
jgi:hypothetical protein